MTHSTESHEGHRVFFDSPHLNWSIEHPLECREHPTPMSQCPTSEYVRSYDEPPVREPGYYIIVGGRFVRSDQNKPRSLIDRLADHVKKNGPVVISYDKAGHFVTASEWGREADDSPMAGAAAYGTDVEIVKALRFLLDQAGVA